MAPGSALTAVLFALLVVSGDAQGAVDADADEVACFHRLCGVTEPGATVSCAPPSVWSEPDSRGWPLAAGDAWQRFSATLVPVAGGGGALSALCIGAQGTRGKYSQLADGASCFVCELRADHTNASPVVVKASPTPSTAAVRRRAPWRDSVPTGLLFSTASGSSRRPESSAPSSPGPATDDGQCVPESDVPGLAPVSADESLPGESAGRGFAMELYVPGLGPRRLSVGHVSVSLIAIGCLTVVLRSRFRA